MSNINKQNKNYYVSKKPLVVVLDNSGSSIRKYELNCLVLLDKM